MAQVTTPRSYGTGPYGVGYYARYHGDIWDCAGVSGITFDAKSLGINRIFHPWAISQITFVVWAWRLLISWDQPAPCLPGDWPVEEPCEDRPWTPPQPCIDGGWVETKPGAGSPPWTQPPGSSAGGWQETRLP